MGKIKKYANKRDFDSLVREYLLELDEVNEETKKQYIKILNYFLEFLKEIGESNPKPEIIKLWKIRLLKEKSPYTVNLYLSAIRRFFSFLEYKGLYKNIARNVRNSKRPFGHKKDFLSDEEILRIFESVDTKDLKGLRDLAMLKFLAFTGIRIYSLVNANIKDIIYKNGKVLFYYISKGRIAKDSVIVLHEEVVKSLKSYLKEREKVMKVSQDDPLFVSLSKNSFGKRLTQRGVRRIIMEYIEKAGINKRRGDKKISPHSFRHTVITKIALEHGIEAARIIAGHRSLGTTQVYYHEAKNMSVDMNELINYKNDREE